MRSAINYNENNKPFDSSPVFTYVLLIIQEPVLISISFFGLGL